MVFCDHLKRVLYLERIFAVILLCPSFEIHSNDYKKLYEHWWVYTVKTTVKYHNYHCMMENTGIWQKKFQEGTEETQEIQHDWLLRMAPEMWYSS